MTASVTNKLKLFCWKCLLFG